MKRLGLGCLTAVLVCGLVASGCGDGDDDEAALRADLVDANGEPAYYVGESFEGNALEDVVRSGGPGGIEGVSAIYGRCTPASDSGCSPPLEIQTFSPGRLPADYPRHIHRTRLKIRGVPALVFAEDGHIEVYTGEVRIDVFGDNPAQTRRAARQLRRAGEEDVGSSLPQPAYPPPE